MAAKLSSWQARNSSLQELDLGRGFQAKIRRSVMRGNPNQRFQHVFSRAASPHFFLVKDMRAILSFWSLGTGLSDRTALWLFGRWKLRFHAFAHLASNICWFHLWKMFCVHCVRAWEGMKRSGQDWVPLDFHGTQRQPRWRAARQTPA